jgi:IS5 family transposase
MKPKSSSYQKQDNFLYQDLLEQLNTKAPLLLLAKKISWEMFEKEFALLYADFGRPAKSIRFCRLALAQTA